MPRSPKPITASLHTVRVVRTLAQVIRNNTRTSISNAAMLAQIYTLLGNLAPTDVALEDELVNTVARVVPSNRQ